IQHPNMADIQVRLLAPGNLNRPAGVVYGPNGDLFVSSQQNNSIVEFNGQTGQFVKIFVPSTANGGLTTPDGLVFGPDNNLYVSSTQSNAVLRFTSTGAAAPAPNQAGATYASANLIDPTGLAFGPDGDLYVASGITNNVLRYYGPIPTGPGVAPVPGS